MNAASSATRDREPYTRSTAWSAKNACSQPPPERQGPQGLPDKVVLPHPRRIGLLRPRTVGTEGPDGEPGPQHGHNPQRPCDPRRRAERQEPRIRADRYRGLLHQAVRPESPAGLSPSIHQTRQTARHNHCLHERHRIRCPGLPLLPPQHGGPHGTRRREVQAPHHMLHLQALRRHRDRIRRIRQHIEDRPHAGEKWVVKPRGEDVPMVFDDLQTTLYEGHLDTDKLMRYGEALRNHMLEDVGREVSDASPTEKNGTPSARRTSGPWRTKTISARGTLHMIA